MKSGNKYRYTIQFGMDTPVKIQVGELLERLGNKKSEVIVAAVCEYINAHPELSVKSDALQIKIGQHYSRADIEAIVLSLLDGRELAGNPSAQTINGSENITVQLNSDIDEDILGAMIDNLDVFNQ